MDLPARGGSDVGDSVEVVMYSRKGCHLCDMAADTLNEMKATLDFNLSTIYIDGDAELEYSYGEQVPVITINGKVHDFFRVDPARFTRAIKEIR